MMKEPPERKAPSLALEARGPRGSVGGRRGVLLVIGLGLVCLVAAGFTIAMAVSTQASTGRAVNAAVLQGRYATELAESALAECLADFGPFIQRSFPGRDWRGEIRSRAVGGVVPGPAVFGVAELTYPPERTSRLTGGAAAGVTVSPVSVRPVRYNVGTNWGLVELWAHSTCQVAGRRTLYRRVSSLHYLVFDAPGTTPPRIIPVAIQTVVDRSDA
ncbi:MAG: hypothetical protein HY815_05670 [Candidatus Riflebacteria bacterium]|nr:hypothetical protein [Candidatus Riflebacteria bacterium]